MANTLKTNKLSVYLVKDEYSDPSEILKDVSALESHEIDGIGTLYYGESHTFPPSWIKTFFGQLDTELPLLNASSKALLLIPLKISKNTTRRFVVPFGYGWSLMNEGVWEERFGLKVTLNTVDPNNLRSIEKQNMASVPKHTTEQMSRDGEVTDFGIDVEQDLIRSVTGRSTMADEFGKIVTGRDALNVSVKVDLSNILSFLRNCWDQYSSNHYKKDFGFIDQIAEIKDPRLLQSLNTGLLDNINQGDLEKTWMAVPEIIDWSDVKGFKYSSRKRDELGDDLHVKDFVDSLTETKGGAADLDTLKQHRVYCIGAANEEVIHSWRVYDCLYCELTNSKTQNVYLLSNGKWYEVERDFAAQVGKEFVELRDKRPSLVLPKYNNKDENDYNESVAASDKSVCCMDRKLISYGGGYSKIEFCDLISDKGKIVHVKHYGGSSVLSHLFSQGVVSGELFLADADFRRLVNDKLTKRHKIDPRIEPHAADYEVVFAVISKSSKKIDLPFFSKVSLRNARRRLRTYGYKVSFQKIDIE